MTANSLCVTRWTNCGLGSTYSLRHLADGKEAPPSHRTTPRPQRSIYTCAHRLCSRLLVTFTTMMDNLIICIGKCSPVEYTSQYILPCARPAEHFDASHRTQRATFYSLGNLSRYNGPHPEVQEIISNWFIKQFNWYICKMQGKGKRMPQLIDRVVRRPCLKWWPVKLRQVFIS